MQLHFLTRRVSDSISWIRQVYWFILISACTFWYFSSNYCYIWHTQCAFWYFIRKYDFLESYFKNSHLWQIFQLYCQEFVKIDFQSSLSINIDIYFFLSRLSRTTNRLPVVGATKDPRDDESGTAITSVHKGGKSRRKNLAPNVEPRWIINGECKRHLIYWENYCVSINLRLTVAKNSLYLAWSVDVPLSVLANVLLFTLLCLSFFCRSLPR